MTQTMTGQRRVLLTQLSLMTVDMEKDDDDVIIEHSLADAHACLPANCPFTFLYLSSEDSTSEDPSHDTEQEPSKFKISVAIRPMRRSVALLQLILTQA